MPFRLLGLAVDPRQAGELCGRAFPLYAASGVEIALVCLAAIDADAQTLRDSARTHGVRETVLLDYSVGDRRSDELTPVLADLLASIQPHVVVAEGAALELRQVISVAFARARLAGGGSGALPAKLYYRAAAAAPGITTAIAVAGAEPPELFVRAFPEPWVSGVLERDLFAGLRPSGPGRIAERLAA